MKRITASLLFLTALSAPGLVSAETPVERQMHSWDYVQSVANPPAPQEAPAMERHEQRPYYHHEAESHHGKHHHGEGKHHHGEGKHHHGKHHHGEGKHHAGHHGHHHKGAENKDTSAPAKDQPKQ